MIEKSIYEDYQINFSDKITPTQNDYIFIFNNNRELFLDETKQLPKNINDFQVNFCLYIGKYNSKDCFVAHADFVKGFDLREVYEFDKDLYLMGGKAVLINDWYISHQFCGRCGTKTQIDEKDMMLKCPSCGQAHYPRISPAIIVAIRKDEELLMAKHSYHDNIRYALIAGFVEPGECIEEAVHREVAEEVGINIKNLNLNDEVIQAVKEEQFHIYAVKNIEEGIEVLTGVPAGKKNKQGMYPAGSINHLVYEKLKKYAENTKAFENR